MRPAWWYKLRPMMRARVVGRSMEPTLADGQPVWVSGWPLWCRSPRRGELVVVRVADTQDHARLDVKRIVGLPGDEIRWQGGRVRVDGRALDEPYATIAAGAPGDDETGVRLSVGQYFVAGDNRLYSVDSRRYGPIDRSQLVGVVLIARARMRAPTRPRV